MKKAIIVFFLIVFALPLWSCSQNWLPLDNGIGCPYGTIRNILVDSNGIIVSGSFLCDGNGNPNTGVAKWDGYKWDTLGNAHIGSADKSGICKYKDTLILSGIFYDNSEKINFAKFDGLSWDTIPNSPDVICFTENDGVLYMGGGS